MNTHPTNNPREVSRIHLKPVQTKPVVRSAGLSDGAELYRLAFTIDAPFLQGDIEIRFPEVLQSSMGFHFLDHYRTTIFPLSEPEPFPQWRQGTNGTELSYAHMTGEDLEFGGSAEVIESDVGLGFYVKNNSSETMLNIEPNMCLEFSKCSDFSSNTLSSIHIVSGGRLMDLSDASPSPVKNGEVWPLILTKRGSGLFQMPPDSPSWTLIDEVAEENLMAIISNDGKYLVGYAWDKMPLTQMSNCRYPCLHTGPGAVDVLEPGQKHSWQGKIYFVEDAQKTVLLNKFKRDQNNWSRMNR